MCCFANDFSWTTVFLTHLTSIDDLSPNKAVSMLHLVAFLSDFLNGAGALVNLQYISAILSSSSAVKEAFMTLALL